MKYHQYDKIEADLEMLMHAEFTHTVLDRALGRIKMLLSWQESTFDLQRTTHYQNFTFITEINCQLTFKEKLKNRTFQVHAPM